MKKTILAATLFLAFSGTAIAGVGVPSEVPTMVEFSNRDINRIVCSGPISDLIFSNEKGLTGHFSGNSAYIKFTIDDEGGKYTYTKEPAELYVVCEGATYTIVAKPVDKQPTTVRLASPESKTVGRNISIFQNMPIEKRAMRLIKQAYNDAYSSSYKVSESSPDKISLRSDLDIVPQITVDVDGIGLRLKTFKVTRLAAGEEINETDFLSTKISKSSILAVAVEDHNLTKGQSTRLFVVETKTNDGPPAMAKTIKTSWSGGE